MALDIRKQTKRNTEYASRKPDSIFDYDPQAESDYLESFGKPDVSGPKPGK